MRGPTGETSKSGVSREPPDDLQNPFGTAHQNSASEAIRITANTARSTHDASVMLIQP